MADLLHLAFAAFGKRDTILRLIQLAGPTIEEAKKAAPEFVPLAKELVAQLFPELQRQMAGKDLGHFSVRWLQGALNKVLHESLLTDGDYGDATKAAVKRYQTMRGLTVDGWAGLEVSSHLYLDLQKL